MARALRAGPPDRGSGTVLVLALVAVLLLLTTTLLALVQAAQARGAAQTAADLAALAAATELHATGAPTDVCAVAERVAHANGAGVERCTVAGGDVVVRTSVAVAPGGLTLHARAQARAGPAG